MYCCKCFKCFKCFKRFYLLSIQVQSRWLKLEEYTLRAKRRNVEIKFLEFARACVHLRTEIGSRQLVTKNLEQKLTLWAGKFCPFKGARKKSWNRTKSPPLSKGNKYNSKIEVLAGKILRCVNVFLIKSPSMCLTSHQTLFKSAEFFSLQQPYYIVKK